ncbi:MAG: 1-acyl-sn-glycerol-3-phosphate acyltransferase [Candidatus Rokubacteria bacterium]|nr:1-acyl-sn-glycerol-3-phosphate acyltransferase [Candidatus Rokubacteria bacterium]
MTRQNAAPQRLPASGDRERAPLAHRVLRQPVRRALERFFDFHVEGAEHLPADEPYIVAANHHNYLDGVVLTLAIPRPLAFIVMPRVYRATPLHPLLHRHVGSIPINLERPDVGALRRALERLRQGGLVGIFPEGPFSTSGRLEPGLPGVGLLALRSGVSVVPAGIRGTYEALRGRWGYVPRRHPLSVRLGVPRRFSPDRLRGRRSNRLAVTQRIMDDIAALLT